MLVKSKVTRYLEFKAISGSVVYKNDKLYKVPSNGKEVLESPLMYASRVLQLVQDY